MSMEPRDLTDAEAFEITVTLKLALKSNDAKALRRVVNRLQEQHAAKPSDCFEFAQSIHPSLTREAWDVLLATETVD